MEKKNDNFIMLPTVDICFKGLMSNPKVRRGFIASLLKTDPVSIHDTMLLPTELRQEYSDDKLGILDVRVMMEDKSQIDMEMQVAYFENWDARSLFYLSRIFTDQLKKGEPYANLKKCIHISILDFILFENDRECYRSITFCDRKTGKEYTDLMEMQILELQKIPKEPENEEEVIKWMRFLSGKSRKEFRNMAKTNEYIAEACKELERMSADERARLEYEARERAIRDYNSQIDSALRRGMQKGIEKGIVKGIAEGIEKGIVKGIEKGKEQMLYEQIQKKLARGKTPAEIADELEDTEENIRTLIARLESR